MLKTYTSHYKVWKSGFAHFILLSFLSRKHSSLKHWFWAEKNWRCVISVYQPSKSSLNFAVIPQKNRRSFLSDVCNLAWIEAVTEMIRHQLFFLVTWTQWPLSWWAPCLPQTGSSSLCPASTLWTVAQQAFLLLAGWLCSTCFRWHAKASAAMSHLYLTHLSLYVVWFHGLFLNLVACSQGFALYNLFILFII